jgi:hypothetical protein
VKAIVKHNGAAAETVSLAYANTPNTFEGSLNITKEGTYEVIVYSFDPANGNSGVDKTTFTVTK